MDQSGRITASQGLPGERNAERREAPQMKKKPHNSVTRLSRTSNPLSGVDGAKGMPYARDAHRGSVKIPFREKVVKFHSTSSSGFLVGETTHRNSLNLDRGGGPLGTQRVARKREPHQGNLAKVARSRMAPTVIKSCTTSHRRIPSGCRAGLTNSHPHSNHNYP